MDSLDNLTSAMTTVQKEKVVDQLSEYLIRNGKVDQMHLLVYEEEGLSKAHYIWLFNSGTPSIARECWKLLVRDTVRRTLYDEMGFIKKSPFPCEACTTDEYMTKLRDCLPPKED